MGIRAAHSATARVARYALRSAVQLKKNGKLETASALAYPQGTPQPALTNFALPGGKPVDKATRKETNAYEACNTVHGC